MQRFTRPAQPAVAVDADAFAARLLSARVTSSFQPTAAIANTTKQTFLCADAVVLVAADVKLGPNASPALKVQALVTRIKDDATDPAIDRVGDCLLGTDRVPKPEDMREDKVAMPRTVRREAKLAPMAYVEVSIFAQANKPQPAASSILPGTRVRFSGLTAGPDKTGAGPMFINAKAVAVLKEVEDAIDGFEEIALALVSKFQQEHALLAALPLFGGVETLVEKYPFLGTVVDEKREAAQQELAGQLRACAERLQGKAAGEGLAYETPVLPADADLAALADKVGKYPEATPLATMLGNQPVLQVPMLVEGVWPGEKFPRSLAGIMTDSATQATTHLVAKVAAVEIQGFNTKVFVQPTIALLGENARDALSFEQSPLTDLPGAALCFRKSQKELAVIFGCPSRKLTEMLSCALLPASDIALVAPAHHRDFGDTIFGDGAAGVNWATSMVIDVPSGVRRVGLEVSRAFVKEAFGGGSEAISDLELEPADVMPTPTGQNLPGKVILRSAGYSAINQKSTNLARLDGARLPAGKQTVKFFVVFEGCGEMTKGTLDENEAAMRAKFGDADLMDKLMAETVLYAVAEGASRVRARDESPATSEAGEAPAVETASEPAAPSGKKRPKRS